MRTLASLRRMVSTLPNNEHIVSDLPAMSLMEILTGL